MRDQCVTLALHVGCPGFVFRLQKKKSVAGIYGGKEVS